MTDDQFDRLMRDAARTYNRPPEIVPFDEMWDGIERERDGGADSDVPPHPVWLERRARRRSAMRWARMAAVLMIGIALGRGSAFLPIGRAADVSSSRVALADPAPMSDQDRSTTNAYLGQAAALMISLPGELRSTHRDTAFVARATNLLLQTRLLIDSPTANDPALHSLFQDLEVVLAQVVRLPSTHDPMQVDLVTNALEQRDVLPRLRLAVADHMAN
jgi:hypothetical protein